MLKVTALAGALVALMIAPALSGCGGGNAEPVSGHPTTSSHAQVTTDTTAKGAEDSAAKVKAAGLAETAKTQAAASYLRIITKFNVADAAYLNGVNRDTHLPAVSESIRTAARAYSAAYTQEVADLRAYGAWPQSVKPLMDQFIAKKMILADSFLQQSAVTRWDSWNEGVHGTDTLRMETSRLSALIRQGLGLPQQPVGQGQGLGSPA